MIWIHVRLRDFLEPGRTFRLADETELLTQAATAPDDPWRERRAAASTVLGRNCADYLLPGATRMQL